jgi:hypothetical protein
MFKTIKEQLAILERQKKVNDCYLANLSLSFELGIDFEELLKELHKIDKALKADEPKKEEGKSE